MNSISKYLLFTLVALSLHLFSTAQEPRRHKIALFTPLYLDSAFDASGNYLHNKTFPKYLNAGLDFYLGAQAALDSLEKRGAPLEVFVYDTKATRPLVSQVNSSELKDVELIIGQTNAQETRALADAALQKKVPFISATLPNDAGVTRNPYFVVLNSSFQSHMEAIAKLLQKNFSQQKIIVFRKPGAQEDLIKRYLNDFTRGATNIRYIDLPNNYSSTMLTSNLDSTQKNICIAGTLDEKFTQKLVQGLSAVNKTYAVTVIGMPTWESINFGKLNIELLYSTPFFYTKNSKLEKTVTDYYSEKTSGRPTDLFYRGYESTLRFALLLLDTNGDVASNITRKGNYVFTQFDIEPVSKTKGSTPDYFENKHLYFVRSMNGTRSVYTY